MNEQKLKILMISTDRSMLLPESSARKRMIEYGKICDELVIILFAKGRNRKPITLSSNVFIYTTNSLSRLFYFLDAFFIALNKTKKDFSLVTAQDPGECGLSAFLISRFLKIPMQVQIHTDILSDSFWQHGFLNKIRYLTALFLIPRASCLRVVSKRIELTLRKIFKDLPPIFVLPVFSFSRKQGENDSKDFLKKTYPKFDNFIISVGRLESEKNYFLAIEAFSFLVLEANRNAALFFLGEGSLKERLKNFANSLCVEDRIFFLGSKTNIDDYYRSADLLLSTSDYEGYGLIFMEAAKNHCPIVSTDVGVIGFELPKESVWLIRDKNPGQIAKLMDEVIDGEDERIKIAYGSAVNLDLDLDSFLQKMRESFLLCLPK